MKKRRNRITALIVCVAVLFGALCAGVIAVSVTSGLFKNNTPTYIKLGTELTGIIRSSSDYEAYMFDVDEPGTLVVKLTTRILWTQQNQAGHFLFIKLLTKRKRFIRRSLTLSPSGMI